MCDRAHAQRREPDAARLRSRALTTRSAHVFAFLVIAIAAAEAAVGLAIVVGIFRNRQSVNLDELTLMKR